MTLVFSPAQAILAAEIGAYCVSPFLGRLDDVGADGMKLLHDICEIFAVQGYTSNVLAASLRHPMHVVDAALAGADIATMPYDVFTKLVKHPLQGREPSKGASKGQRQVFQHGKWQKADIWEMSELKPRNEIDGLAVIEAPNTTLFVPPEWHVRIDEHDIYWLTRGGAK